MSIILVTQGHSNDTWYNRQMLCAKIATAARAYAPKEVKCHYAVWVRDAYRYTGGNKQFRLHYTMRQCKRNATVGRYCKQHATPAASATGTERATG